MEEQRQKIALVTGANRGLGRECCRQLAEQGYRVVLAARRAQDATTAADALGVESLPLDVTESASIAQAASTLRERYGSIDVLVNNAGVSKKGFDAEVVRATLAVNLHGAVAVTDALRPLLSKHGIVVMVSSGMGQLSCLSTDLAREFGREDLTREALLALLARFVEDVQDGTWKSKGWPGSAYRVSKVGLNAFTRILAREEQMRTLRVNAVCPGWVRTDMGGLSASRSVEEGAASIVWAATIPADGPTGGFFRDGVRISW